MFELVPSEWMREYLKSQKREFSDWEKATLIWNSPVHTRKEIIDSLKELADITDDDLLSQQIMERVDYEEKAYRLFINNRLKKFVYIVLDNERYPCGYFSEFELARNYAVNYSSKHECKCSIEKQLIWSDETKKDVLRPWISEENILKDPIFDSDDYDGTENALVKLNAEGEIIDFYSFEMPHEEKKRVDPLRRERFEYQFFKIPFGMEMGTIVRIINDGTYAVLDAGEEDWNNYMMRTDENPSYYDYSDIQVVAFKLMDGGYWSHMHVNPMYLEPCDPKAEKGNKKEALLVCALYALSNYFKDETSENNDLAIRASREYAKESQGRFNWGQLVYESNKIEKLIF